MRVLHVIVGLGLGGAETLLYRLATRDSGIDHEVIALGGRDWYSSRLEAHGIVVHHLGVTSLLSAPVAAARLRKLIQRSDADVVQCWLYAANVVAGIYAKRARIPVVWGVHSSTLEPVGKATRMLAYAGGVLARWIPDFVINCSSRSAQLHAKFGYAAAPGAVIHNGYDPGSFFPDEEARAKTRQALGVGAGTFLIGSIGRWNPQKDFPNLLSALRKLREEGVPLQCILAGSGLLPSNDELMNLIRSFGCEALVTPLGPREDMRDIDRAIDLHVLSSSGGEAFPNVVAETMLSGTPNVVTDIGDSAMIVGETGWAVPPRDSGKLAAAILEARMDWEKAPSRWQSRRVVARKRIADDFTFEQMARAYEAIWAKAAARRL